METIQPWEGVVEFVTVAEQHGFVAAARKLGMSVAQVSRQVSALEARHGHPFAVSHHPSGQRHRGRAVVLPALPAAAGWPVGRRAGAVISQAHPSGHLRLTAPVYYGETVIAPLFLQYLAHHPAVSAELNLDNRKVDLVAENFDLGIRLGPMDGSSLMLRELAVRVHHVCASPAYLATTLRAQTLAELRQHACLVGTVESWRFLDSGQVREVHVSGPLRCNSGVALRRAALAGMGLVQLPDYYVDEALARAS